MQEIEDLLEAGDGDRRHAVIGGKHGGNVSANDLGMKGDILAGDAEGVTLADKPIANALAIVRDRNGTIEKAAALAHVIDRFVGLGGALGAFEVAAVAGISSLLGLTDQPLVVVTAGGGGDGFALLRAITDAVVGWPGGAPFHALVVTGPLMAANKRQVLRQAQAASDRLTVLEFTPRLFTYMAAADLIIGMAGYNTVVEALSLGKRTLYVPRTRPRQEQLIRAERLADRGWARLILPEALSADTLAAQITLALSGPAPHITASLDGLTTVGATIAGLFDLQPQSALALGRPA